MMKRFSAGYEAAASGFSDEKLERLSQHSILERGLTPWGTWESENSSFGKTFREWACYPSFLPLCFSSDHGVHWESKCWPNEVNSPYQVYLTWNKKKSIDMRQNHRKLSYYVPHPWVFHRKRIWGDPPSNRIGTLVYYAHSNGTTTPLYKDIDQYIYSLINLPSDYQPVVICVSFHDIQKNTHKKLRKYGIPIVTGGSTGAKDFVDRFYSLAYQFRYATSPNIGSHTFYVLEAGIPFFVFGDHPEYIYKGSDAVPDGLNYITNFCDEEEIARLERLRNLLSVRQKTVSNEQLALVNDYLGLNSNISRSKAILIFWGAFFNNLDKVASLYAKTIYRLVKTLIIKNN
jgi:hypothetical protein